MMARGQDSSSRRTQGGRASAGAKDLARYTSSGASPVVADIPNNGMFSGTISIEPINGNGATPGVSPATIVVSSFWKDNDPTPSQNYCHITAQVILRGSP